VTYAAKIDKAEARLDFGQPAEAVERQVRAFNPAPGAFFELDGERYKVLAATVTEGDSLAVTEGNHPGTVIDDGLTVACGSDALRITRIQRAGKPVMDAAELLRGRPIPAGTQLT